MTKYGYCNRCGSETAHKKRYEEADAIYNIITILGTFGLDLLTRERWWECQQCGARAQGSNLIHRFPGRGIAGTNDFVPNRTIKT